MGIYASGNMLSFQRMHFLVVVFYFFYITFIGPYKYVLISSSLSPLLYAPQLMMALVVLFYVLQSRGNLTITILVIVLLSSVTVGILHSLKVLQIVLGLYVWLPVLFGIFSLEIMHRRKEFFLKLFPLLLALTGLGIVLDWIYILPWGDIEYEVGGEVVQATRGGGYLGVKRAAGFSGFHWTAASLALFYGIFICSLSQANKLYLVAIWCLVGMIVFITMAKGIIVAYLLVTLVYLSKSIMRIWMLKAGMGLVIVMGFTMPILASFYKIDSGGKAETVFDFFTYTLFTRIGQWWPYMLDIILNNSSVVLGRGLGSFGAASIRYEQVLPASGDNIYLYLWANLGIPGLLFFIAGCVIYLLVFRLVSKWDRFISMLFLTIITYGVIVNVIEFGIFGFAFGLVVSYFVQYKKINAVEISKCILKKEGA